MKKTTKNVLSVTGAIAGIAAAAGGFELWSRTKFGRSGAATAAEGAIRATGFRNVVLGRDLGRYDDFVEKSRVRNECEYQLPSWLRLRSLVFEETLDGMKVYHVGTTGKNEHVVLYLHGGGYVCQITPAHWRFVDKLCQESGAEVVVPIYPLAPEHDYDEAYTLLTSLYEGLCRRYGADAITLMGDSAGGALALGLAESLPQSNLEQPANLVLISPELDLSMRNPKIADYFDKDPMLAPWGVAQMGDLWADGDEVSNYRLSPKNGDVSQLRNVLLLAGTREIYYPDCAEFAQKLVTAGIPSDLVIGKGMNHNWPLLPIPEARKARKRIVECVLRKVN